MQNFNNIILFGGETKNENMPVGFYSSLALLPLRGKPLIWWQLNNLKEQGLDNFIVVVCKENNKLIKYIKNILFETFNITLVTISKNKNILSSLKYGLKKANLNIPTRVILGDTFLNKSISEEKDILYTSKNFTISDNWCLVEKSKNTINFYDKQNNLDTKNKEVLVGYYTFSDTKTLLDCCIKSRLLLKKEISTAIIEYQKKYKLKLKLVNDWIDLGHTSGLIKVKNKLFNARDFNSIQVNTDIGILTKKSIKIQKLEDEAFWFNTIPDDLKILSPRFISFSKNKDYAELSQELYGYPTLQELYLSGEVNLEDWSCIIEKLFNLHKNFEKYTIKNQTNSLNWLYYNKTFERIEQAKEQNDYWKKLFDKEIEYINGKEFKGLKLLEKDLKNKAKNISNIDNLTIMHGDFCFSNILFDSSNYIFKLIDPRGRLDNNATIYGDNRYDIAKLRHSICGLYDFIVHKMFKLNETNSGFEYKILLTKDYSVLEKIFDDFAEKNGFIVNDIKFIEGLLFLSMIPLHKDDINRQKMFYIRAIELLNNTL